VYTEPRFHERLMRVVDARLGHALAGRAEQAKIDVAAGGGTEIDLGQVEDDLRVSFNEERLIEATGEEVRRIVDAARGTLRQAGIDPRELGAIYFTGGSTGLKFLADSIAAAFPHAQRVVGDRLASVATGLGIHAKWVFS
jgi:hypothetical chaperone protein